MVVVVDLELSTSWGNSLQLDDVEGRVLFLLFCCFDLVHGIFAFASRRHDHHQGNLFDLGKRVSKNGFNETLIRNWFLFSLLLMFTGDLAITKL